MIQSIFHNVLALNLPSASERFRHINYGGCGMVAHTLASNLIAHGVDCDIVFVNSGRGSREKQDKWIKDFNARDINELIYKSVKLLQEGDVGSYTATNPVQNYHVAVCVDNRLYDASGDITDNHHAITDSISLDALELILKHPDYWNDLFMSTHGDELTDIETFVNNIVKIAVGA